MRDPCAMTVLWGKRRGSVGVASRTVRDVIPPVPPKTAKNRPQPSKSAIESHLRFAESFRVHGPISTSEFAAVLTPPHETTRCVTPKEGEANPESGLQRQVAPGSPGRPERFARCPTPR